MEIAKLNIDEIEARMSELKEVDVDALTDIEEVRKISDEIDALTERKAILKAEADSKKELRNKIAENKTETQEIEKPKENRTMELNKENYLASKEYRSAFLKTLQGKELNAEERSAYALADVEAVVPQELQNTIIEKAKEYAPILTHVELLSVNGVVKVAVEGVVAGAKDHEENAVIEADKDTLVEVELTTHEIVKLVQISASVKSMSMPAFEAWLVAKLAEAIAMKIENTIFTTILANGEQAGTEVSYASILALFSKLKSAYARNAKLYMSRETLYTKVIALQDKSKHDMVVLENGAYKLMGVEIHCTDTVANAIVLCDPKKFIANMAENIAVKSAYDINTNSYKYLGVAQFDGKVAFAEAFQIIKIA
jgi:HK97 family phage major capsid protein